MSRSLLLFIIIGLLLSACRGALIPAPTSTAVPTQTPTKAVLSPALIREIKLETQTGTSYTLDWSKDGETLAAGSGFEITLMNRDFSKAPVVLEPEGGALGISWSPDGSQIATINGFQNTDITIWSTVTDSAQITADREIVAGSDQYGVSWSPHGKLLATLGDDDKTTIQIWDTGTWEELHRFELPYDMPRRALNWSADSTTLYEAGQADGQVVVFGLKVSDGTVQELGKFPVDEVYVFAISPDGKYITVADERGTVQFVDVTSGKTITSIKTVDQPVDLAWNPDGGMLAVLSYKAALQVWSVGR